MKKNKILLIAIALIVLIIVGVFAYLKFFTKAFYTPEQLFYTYLSQNDKMLKGAEITKNMINEANTFDDSMYTKKGELTLNAKVNNNQLANIGNLKITVNGNYDNLENKAYEKYMLTNAQNEKLFNFELLRNNNIYGITSDQVINMYLADKEENVKKMLKKSGAEGLAVLSNINEVNNISKSDLDKIVSKYKSIIEDNTKNKYIKQKHDSINFGEKKYEKVNQYSLKLSQKEFGNIAKQVLEKLKDDDETLNIILEASMNDKTIDNLNNLKTQINSLLNQMDIESLTDDEFLNLSVYEKNDELIYTDIKLNIDDKLLEIELSNNYDGQILNGTINVYVDDNKIEINYNISQSELNVATTISDTKISFSYKQETEQDKSSKNLALSLYRNGANVELNYNEQDKVAQNLQIPALEENNNCVMLSSFTDEEQNSLLDQIGNRIGEIFQEMGNKYGEQYVNDFAILYNAMFPEINNTMNNVTSQLEAQQKELEESRKLIQQDTQNLNNNAIENNNIANSTI